MCTGNEKNAAAAMCHNLPSNAWRFRKNDTQFFAFVHSTNKTIENMQKKKMRFLT